MKLGGWNNSKLCLKVEPAEINEVWCKDRLGYELGKPGRELTGG